MILNQRLLEVATVRMKNRVEREKQKKAENTRLAEIARIASKMVAHLLLKE